MLLEYGHWRKLGLASLLHRRGYRQALNALALGPLGAVYAGALLVLCKFLLGSIHIAIDFPAPDTLALAGMVMNKTTYILRRIA